MRIIGILVLSLELISLVIALRNECHKNNITLSAIQAKLKKLKRKFWNKTPKPKTKMERIMEVMRSNNN